MLYSLLFSVYILCTSFFAVIGATGFDPLLSDGLCVHEQESVQAPGLQTLRARGKRLAIGQLLSQLKEQGENMRQTNDAHLEALTQMPRNYKPRPGTNSLKFTEDMIKSHGKDWSRDVLIQLRRLSNNEAMHLERNGKSTQATELRDRFDYFQAQAVRYFTWTAHFKRQYAEWKSTGKWTWDKSFGTPHGNPLAKALEQLQLEGHRTFRDSSDSSSIRRSDHQGTSNQPIAPSANALKNRRRRQRANAEKAAKAAGKTEGNVETHEGGGGSGGSNEAQHKAGNSQ